MATPPKPYSAHRVSTVFLRVPAGEWAAVHRGFKREFRSAGHGYPALFHVQVPTPVVLYMTRDGSRHESKLAVLERTWREPLGAISEESLRLEGHASLAHFRRYWMGRTKRRFRPLSEVQVYRVRPFEPDDAASLGAVIFERLYGEFLHGR